MRGPLKYLAPLILVPFLACTDTPAEPDTEEAPSFKAERPPNYGDWVVVNVQCSGRYRCIGTVMTAEAPETGYDCQHYESQTCADNPPYIETPAAEIGWQIAVADDGGVVCVRAGHSDVSALPLTYYCLNGDKIAGKITFTRVIND